MALHGDGRLLHNEVADRCAVRAGTLTGVVDTLVRSGHVERVNNEGDRRAVWVNLTAEGSAVAAQLHRRVQHRDALTSIDADPDNEAVIRRFLIEFITRLSDKEDNDSGRGSSGPGQAVPEDTGQRGRSALVRG
jgi:MarR family transcriptional regulator, organic hydroperoxide resistance regulator